MVVERSSESVKVGAYFLASCSLSSSEPRRDLDHLRIPYEFAFATLCD